MLLWLFISACTVHTSTDLMGAMINQGKGACTRTVEVSSSVHLSVESRVVPSPISVGGACCIKPMSKLDDSCTDLREKKKNGANGWEKLLTRKAVCPKVDLAPKWATRRQREREPISVN